MDGLRPIRNEDVARAVVGVPEGHTHIRALLELADGTHLLLHEATLANLCRAYTTVKTHPTRSCITLAGRELPDRKPGYAAWQLVEEETQGGALELRGALEAAE